MKLSQVSPKAKWALVMMLVAIFPTLAGITIGIAVFGEAAPPFVYILPAIWLVLFFVSLARLKVGLIGGVAWSVVSLFAPVGVALQGIRSSLAQTRGMPVCPFSIVGAGNEHSDNLPVPEGI
jgi:ABC-type amino acid transport substrate-binding protein